MVPSKRASLRWAASALLLAPAPLTESALAQSAGEATLPARERRAPREASVAPELDRLTLEAAELLESGRAVLATGRPGLDLGTSWSELGQRWRLVASDVHLLVHPSREPLEALRVEALADRADFELWRCESAAWHTDPNWFARRALTRVAAFPDGGDGRAFLAYAQCLTSVDTLFDAARRSIVEAHPASLSAADATLEELTGWLSGPLARRIAQARLGPGPREALTNAHERARAATVAFRSWLADSGEIRRTEVSHLAETSWFEGLRSASGSRRNAKQMERLLLDRLRSVETPQLLDRDGPAEPDVEATELAVRTAIAHLVATDPESSPEIRVAAALASDAQEAFGLAVDEERVLVELHPCPRDAGECDLARRSADQQPLAIASKVRGHVFVQRLRGATSLLPDELGEAGLALAWPALEGPTGSEGFETFLREAAESELDRRCLLFLANLRLHSTGGKAAEARRTLETLGDLSSEESADLVERLELAPLAGIEALIALEWLELLEQREGDLRVLRALREVPGLRAGHLAELEPAPPRGR